MSISPPLLNERNQTMKGGSEVSPLAAGIIIAVIVVILGVGIWIYTGKSRGGSGVGATSAALAHGAGQPAAFPKPAIAPGASSSVPMPGKTPIAMPNSGGK